MRYNEGAYGAVVLLSGGMDSTTALAVALGKPLHGDGVPHLVVDHDRDTFGSGEVLALSFDYGQRHREQELDAAGAVAKYYNVDHHIIDLRTLTPLLHGSSLTDPSIAVPDGHYEEETMRVTVVPNRNAIMLSIAFGVARAAGATRVFAGMHSGDHAIYPDCRSAFIRAFQRCMNLANADIADDPAAGPMALPLLQTPFIDKSKADIVRIGDTYDVPYQLTYSCYKGRQFHCGVCGTCTERKEAFELALGPGTDPTVYELNMHGTEGLGYTEMDAMPRNLIDPLK